MKRALFEHHGPQNHGEVRRYQFDGFETFPIQRVLSRDGVRVPLTGKPIDTLLLVERASETVAKDDLRAQVWNGQETHCTVVVPMACQLVLLPPAASRPASHVIQFPAKAGWKVMFKVNVSVLPFLVADDPVPLTLH